MNDDRDPGRRDASGPGWPEHEPAWPGTRGGFAAPSGSGWFDAGQPLDQPLGQQQQGHQRHDPTGQPTNPIPQLDQSGRPVSSGGRGWHAAPTGPIPAVVPDQGLDHDAAQADEQTEVIQPSATRRPSLLKTSGSMAVPTLISRITGFLWKLMLAWVVGAGTLNDSFMVANNLPNQVFELLIGGVLTSVVVPVLVRAEKSDDDGGQAYIQRLLTLSVVVLGVGTVLSVVGAGALVALFSSDSANANPELATCFAYLLLPQIFFYGLSALISAVLQARQVFAPTVWAPVINNLVVIATLVVYYLLPGQLTLHPLRMDDPHLLTLGIGVTCGVVAQACCQAPALRRTGFRFQWRWGWDPRLSEFGGLALWMIAYVLVSQVGLAALSQVGTSVAVWSMYQYVWLLLQLPYGVIGFSVMTAILPRMSAAAADGDHQRLIDDLSLGNRMSTVTLLPISALMSAVGAPIALALFSLGKASGSAEEIGTALAVSSFGVLPYALTMMQMRVFYALKDARTPTMIMIVMTVAKVGLALPCLWITDHAMVLYALVVVNSFSFVIGWLVGEMWLRHRLGPLGSRRFLSTLGRTLAASALGGGLAWLATVGVDAAVPGAAGLGTGWLQLGVGTVVAGAAIFGLMSAFRVAELEPAIGRVTGLLRRR